MHDHITIVLHQPQDVRNLGAVVRAMKNFGFSQLRLVQPCPFDPADLSGIAHRSEDLVAAIQIYPDLTSALADMRYVVGTSERIHAERPMRTDLRQLAAELVGRASQHGGVALLCGPEDHGLDQAAFDRCDSVLRLPTDPRYPSLNLAQAVLLLLYELHLAAPITLPEPIARMPATNAAHEQFAAVLLNALQATGFIKSGDG
ncbi:MAG: RNA methyltransferase, partial [Oscillochloridaceae bacterium umkhey_bin13]